MGSLISSAMVLRLVQPSIGPKRGEHRKGHHAENRSDGRRFYAFGEAEPIGRLIAHGQTADDDEGDREELKHHEDVLHHRTLTNAADVDERGGAEWSRERWLLRELSHGHHA